MLLNVLIWLGIIGLVQINVFFLCVWFYVLKAFANQREELTYARGWRANK